MRHKVGMAVLHCLDELLHDAKYHSDLVVTLDLSGSDRILTAQLQVQARKDVAFNG